MTDALAESAYRRASAHWSRCFRCRRAGGEQADPRDLCPVGRQLRRLWDAAERRAGRHDARRGRAAD